MIHFVANMTSGRGLGGRNIKRIVSYCKKHNVEISVHQTNGPKNATEITKMLCENGADTIVAVGGDGTFHEVLNGVPDLNKVRIGFIPSGRGNDFARGMHISRNPKVALKNIIDGETINIDYIQVSDKRCLNVAGTGMDTDVLERVDGKHGKITYLAGLISCLRNFHPYEIDITVDGKCTRYKALLAAVCNSSQFGGGIKVGPVAKADDGKLDVIIITVPSNGKVFSLVPKFARGKHMNDEYTTWIRCEQIHIHEINDRPIQLDGEIYYGLDFDCKIIKGGLTTFKIN